MIYLDNNATTKVANEVLEVMRPFFTDSYGNPSSLYGFGQASRRTVEEARGEIQKLLGAKSEREIIFTSGGTESNHLAILSALRSNPTRKRIMTSQVEHSSVKNLCQSLGREGYEIIWIGVSPTGSIDLEALKAFLDESVALVSIMWANNETGVLFPIEQIAEITRKKKISFHVDGIQAVGKLEINLSNIPIDYLSFSAHKFHGPKGIGGLYAHEGAPLTPLFVGGRQERDRRAGTENVPGIIGEARALKLVMDHYSEHSKQIRMLRDRLEEGLLRQIPDSFVNGRQEPRISNTTNITIPGIEAEVFLIRLSEVGIAASGGSACLTGALEPSHVLQAMGLSRELSASSVRLSLSRYTTAGEIDQALEVIPKLVRELRRLGEVWK